MVDSEDSIDSVVYGTDHTLAEVTVSDGILDVHTRSLQSQSPIPTTTLNQQQKKLLLKEETFFQIKEMEEKKVQKEPKEPQRIKELTAQIINHPKFHMLSESSRKMAEDPEDVLVIRYFSKKEVNQQLRDIWKHLYLQKELPFENVYETLEERQERKRNLMAQYGFFIDKAP